MNLGMSPGFQQQDYEHMTFPAYMYVDYVRVYQREGLDTDQSIGCDPSKRPTADYIAKYVFVVVSLDDQADNPPQPRTSVQQP